MGVRGNKVTDLEHACEVSNSVAGRQRGTGKQTEWRQTNCMLVRSLHFEEAEQFDVDESSKQMNNRRKCMLHAPKNGRMKFHVEPEKQSSYVLGALKGRGREGP